MKYPDGSIFVARAKYYDFYIEILVIATEFSYKNKITWGILYFIESAYARDTEQCDNIIFKNVPRRGKFKLDMNFCSYPLKF